MADQIRYDLLTQQALRSVVRGILADAAKKGLPGDHHFYISFDTKADGVRLSDRLRAQYPDEMTIILQHQFWDLKVNDDAFEVGLSFGGVPEKLNVPFEAINGFFDPSVQFGLQFEEVGEGNQAPQKSVPANSAEKTDEARRPRPVSAKRPRPAGVPSVAAPPAKPALTAEKAAKTEKPAKLEKPGGGEIVQLDRFRKK